MITLGVLCSGGLGFDTLVKIHKEYQIKFILTDEKSIEIIQFSKEQEIPLFIGNPRNGTGYQFIKNISVDVITSINYLFLIANDIISHPEKLIFNIHGSLLPKYRGRTPHVWAIINGEKKTGITAHLIIGFSYFIECKSTVWINSHAGIKETCAIVNKICSLFKVR